MKRMEYINTRKYVAFAVLFGALLSIILPSIGLVGATGVGSCTLSPKSGRMLVFFNEELVSDGSLSDAQSDQVSVFLAKGSYKVTLVAFDSHSTKGEEVEANESWFAVLRDSSGGSIVSTDSTRDIPSSIDTLTQVVNSNLQINKDVSSVKAVHSAFPSSDSNSVRAVCAAFDKLDDSTAGEDTENGDNGSDGIIQNINENINNITINVQNFFGDGGDSGNGDNNNSNSPGAPDILRVSAEDIEDDRITFTCRVDANGSDTDVWFEWDDDQDDVEDGRGEETRSVEVDGDETSKDVEITVRNLDEDTRYFFRCHAENSEGEDVSRVHGVRTDELVVSSSGGDDPEAVTLAATSITQTTVRLNGTVDPNGEDTDAWFEWGTSPSALNRSTSVYDAGDGASAKKFSAVLTNLSPGTAYYFRAVAESREGIDRGATLTFTTHRFIVPSVLPAVTQVVTRVVEVARDEDEVKAFIVTLEANRAGGRNIEYTISYDNKSGDAFSDAVLTVVMPDELEFVDASPKEDSFRRGELTFEIGAIRSGDKDSFVVETEAGSIDEDEVIVLTATLEYVDGGKSKAVTVVDESTLGEIGKKSNFAAGFFGNAVDFLTNPFFWFLVLILLIFLVYRYFALLARPKEEEVVIRESHQPMQEERLLPN